MQFNELLVCPRHDLTQTGFLNQVDYGKCLDVDLALKAWHRFLWQRLNTVQYV